MRRSARALLFAQRAVHPFSQSSMQRSLAYADRRILNLMPLLVLAVLAWSELAVWARCCRFT